MWLLKNQEERPSLGCLGLGPIVLARATMGHYGSWGEGGCTIIMHFVNHCAMHCAVQCNTVHCIVPFLFTAVH